MTLAELHYGVLRARTDGERALRLRRLALVESEFDPLPIDGDVARAYGAIVAGARATGKRPKTADALIAATAAAHGLAVYTRDADFEGLPGVDVVVLT
jgi:predicted nucleic acid-binding protein